ncbi:MAG: putative nuclease [Verrucomicrobiaceae bacterium]|nr:putative nuclease [Verrucomicrobiaceae bacterium]
MSGIILSAIACCLYGADTEVLTSPHGNCEARIVQEIGHAQQTIRVEAYTLTSKPMLAALVAAQARRVQVTLIIDGNYGRKTSLHAMDALQAAGAVVVIDSQEDEHGGIAHIKCVLIDGLLVMAGSYNWTGQANTRNHEALFLITAPTVLTAMTADFQLHFQHSHPYVPVPAPKP